MTEPTPKHYRLLNQGETIREGEEVMKTKWCKHIKYVPIRPLMERRYIYDSIHNGECYVEGWKRCPECGVKRPKGNK